MKRQADEEAAEAAGGEDGEGSWIPGGGSAAQRRRRDLVSRACEPCRRSKTKCDEQRPCARCTSRRTISQCLGKVPLQSVNGYVECPHVERPMSYDGTQYVGDPNRAPGQKGPFDLIPTMEAGWSDEAVGAVFENMPLSLRNNLINGLRMLESFRQQSAAFFDKVPVQENGMSMSAVEGIERQMWNAVPTTGIMQVSLDPMTGQRRAIFMNQRFASIFGYHREELLTRMVQREVPMAMSPLEFICLMIDEIQNGMSVSCDRVLRLYSEMNDGAIFVKHLQHKSFDRFGRLIKVTLYYDTVDSAALDVIRSKHPALARPFSNHLGDMRSGAELLAQARSDLDVTINEIERSSEAGARLVRELENLLAMTLEPFAHAAAHLDNLMRMQGRFAMGHLAQPHGPGGAQHPQQHPGQAPPMQPGPPGKGGKGKSQHQSMAQQAQQRMGPGGWQPPQQQPGAGGAPGPNPAAAAAAAAVAGAAAAAAAAAAAPGQGQGAAQGPQAGQVSQGLLVTPQKGMEGNKAALDGMLQHLQRMGGSQALLAGVPADVSGGGGGGSEGFTPGRLVPQGSLNGLGTSQSNLMNLIQPGAMWPLPAVSSGALQMPGGGAWNPAAQAGAGAQSQGGGSEVKGEPGAEKQVRSMGHVGSRGRGAGLCCTRGGSAGVRAGGGELTGGVGEGQGGQGQEGGQQGGGQGASAGGEGADGAQPGGPPPLQTQGSLNPLSLTLGGQGAEGGFPAALQHQGSMTQLPGMQGLGSMQNLMPGAQNLLLRQGSIANAAELVRQNSNLGDLVRQNSLSWGMQGANNAGRPELLRSDTELSFSMVW